MESNLHDQAWQTLLHLLSSCKEEAMYLCSSNWIPLFFFCCLESTTSELPVTVQSWGVHYQAGTAKLYCSLLELNSGHTQLLCCLIRTVFQVRTSDPELEQIIAEGIKQERREMKFLKDIYMTNFLQNLFKNRSSNLL